MIQNSFTGYGQYDSASERTIYRGQFMGNKRHGIGRLSYIDDNLEYYGQFRKGVREGHGVQENKKFTVKGYWVNDHCILANIKPFEDGILSPSISSINISFAEPLYWTLLTPVHFTGIIEAYLMKKHEGSEKMELTMMEIVKNSKYKYTTGQLKLSQDDDCQKKLLNKEFVK